MHKIFALDLVKGFVSKLFQIVTISYAGVIKLLFNLSFMSNYENY